jgi:hypothetical protein
MEEKAANSIEEISQADWEKTPQSVKRLVRSLMGRIEQLERQYEKLEAENQLLKEQVKLNSKNSSKPPSQDVGKGFKPKARSTDGKKQGGQPGHEGHSGSLYPIEACESVEEYRPLKCWRCGEALHGDDPQPHRVQIVELPEVVPVIQEHRFHQLECECCGAWTRGWDEEIINGSRYGERVVAHVALLSGLYRQSHRMVQQLLWELFGIEMSVGSINRLRQEAGDAVEQPVIQAWDYVQAQDNVNIDETSFTQGNGDGSNPTGRRGWLWAAVTPRVSYFVVCLSRSQAVAKQLLGEGFTGIVNSDRLGAYNWLELGQRQICWAYLKRDFTQIAERPGRSSELGKALLEQQQFLFEHWYRVRDGTLTRAEFMSAVTPIRQQVQILLCQAAGDRIGKHEKTPWAKTVRTCQQLLKLEPALWTFVTTEGIEPTNNAAERALRPAVLWRQNSFGSQSRAGSEFVSRMLTVATTLRAQNRSVLDYLIHACRAARQGKSAPSLLPADSPTS